MDLQNIGSFSGVSRLPAPAALTRLKILAREKDEARSLKAHARLARQVVERPTVQTTQPSIPCAFSRTERLRRTREQAAPLSLPGRAHEASQLVASTATLAINGQIRR